MRDHTRISNFGGFFSLTDGPKTHAKYLHEKGSVSKGVNKGHESIKGYQLGALLPSGQHRACESQVVGSPMDGDVVQQTDDPILAPILILILISVSHSRWGLDFCDPSPKGSIQQGSMSHGAEF